MTLYWEFLIPKDFDAKTPEIFLKIWHYTKNFYFPRILMQKLQKLYAKYDAAKNFYFPRILMQKLQKLYAN